MENRYIETQILRSIIREVTFVSSSGSISSRETRVDLNVFNQGNFKVSNKVVEESQQV